MITHHPSNKHPVYIVQGAQWGSEGKGQIAAVLAKQRHCGAVVRTGSINAGHTVYYEGREFKMQLLPTAWVVPGVRLVLGPGCFIHRETLQREVALIKEATGEDIRHRLFIDSRCTVHTTEAEDRGKQAGRHHEMGATGKGSSESVIDRLNARGDVGTQAPALLFRNRPRTEGFDFSKCITDTTHILDYVLRQAPVLLEGTQGAHLDLFTGPWPFTSNRPVSTAAWLAYAGLAPTLDVRPILVARTFPIRVAGNSGPMPNEITWPQLARRVSAQRRMVSEAALLEFEANLDAYFTEAGVPNLSYQAWTEAMRYQYRRELSEGPSIAYLACRPVAQIELASFFEMTTVTRKLRRIAEWDIHTVREAIRWNGCAELWVSFLNYLFPHLWEADAETVMRDPAAMAWLRSLREDLDGVTISGVTTGRFPEHHLSVC